MNEDLRLIADTTARILRDRCPPEVVDAAEEGRPARDLWQTLADNGLVLAGIDEARGGGGAGGGANLVVLRECGRYAVPLPVAETMMAATLFADAGVDAGTSMRTIACGDFTLSGSRLLGSAASVPFARIADEIVVIADRDGTDVLVVLAPDLLRIEPGANMAGEARDTVVAACDIDPASVVIAPADCRARLRLLGAAARSAQMAGAIESTLEISVDYAMTRTQFGRPLAKFQAIQHQLAILAGESAACLRAADALECDAPTFVDVAVAKARIGEACTVVTDIAHQVHGAIGYTREHPLNHRTRRLWSWRDEYGSEREWQVALGRVAIEGGADHTWDFITRT